MMRTQVVSVDSGGHTSAVLAKAMGLVSDRDPYLGEGVAVTHPSGPCKQCTSMIVGGMEDGKNGCYNVNTGVDEIFTKADGGHIWCKSETGSNGRTDGRWQMGAKTTEAEFAYHELGCCHPPKGQWHHPNKSQPHLLGSMAFLSVEMDCSTTRCDGTVATVATADTAVAGTTEQDKAADAKEEVVADKATATCVDGSVRRRRDEGTKPGGGKCSCRRRNSASGECIDNRFVEQAIFCADEHKTCKCDGEVFYGSKFTTGRPGSGAKRTFSQLKDKAFKQKVVTGSIQCSNGAFGDPVRGYKKHCMCVAAPQATTPPVATGDFTVTCQDSGVLTDPMVCNPVKCGTAPAVARATASIAGSVSFGQHLIYRCEQGYTSDGTTQGTKNFQRQCQSDGTFSELAGSHQCKPISGGVAPQIGDAIMTQFRGDTPANQNPEIHYGDGLEYQCIEGFSTNGLPSGETTLSSMVDSDGELSPALAPNCVAITYTINGKAKDSSTGSSLHGVTVRLEGPSSLTTQTSSGVFSLGGVKHGSYTLTYKKDGYIDVTRSLDIHSNINSGGVADVAMAPKMQSDQWRGVVTWNKNPRDLDTYAYWGATGQSGKVYYGRRHRNLYGMDLTLEVDKTGGYGPETIYFKGIGSCRMGGTACHIQFKVNDYTRTGRMNDMAYSGATVNLYKGDRLMGTYTIGDCPRSVSSSGWGRNNWWHVFTIDGKQNKLIWDCKTGGSAVMLTQNASSYEQTPPVLEHDAPIMVHGSDKKLGGGGFLSAKPPA